ncbi:PREDICTED: retinol dehydrogenase 12-like [Branchiostoma belcheri]|uniref:Retinol dehydrogenase 12-like n=1 Tax=Branchiostoma belcheri TaxID=7741 RepID=A0A6P5ACP5_BRABE|nr:PREDICTED: retinol dehydrogenase 12-like [Branchiostoma belcheri]
MEWYLVLLVVVFLLVVLQKWWTGRFGYCKSQADMRGKTVIITGANTGIGKATALELARRHARVILACRNRNKAEATRDDIIKITGNTSVLVKEVDLSSLASVRTFAQDIYKEEPQLDVLINNAGTTGPAKRTLTEEGLELTFAANHFGHFLLTNLLLDLLKKSSPSRIVNVASMAHLWGKVDFDNLSGEKWYHEGRAYCDSKLMNILFTRELSNRLVGTGVTVNALHPGTVQSELFRSAPWFIKVLFHRILKPYLKTPYQGAQCSIYCAVSEDMARVSGQYVCDCRIQDPAKHGMDEGTAKKLWEVSERLTGLAS